MVLSKGKFRLSRKLSRSWQVSFSSGPDRLCNSGKQKETRGEEKRDVLAINFILEMRTELIPAKYMHGTIPLVSGDKGQICLFLIV